MQHCHPSLFLALGQLCIHGDGILLEPICDLFLFSGDRHGAGRERERMAADRGREEEDSGYAALIMTAASCTDSLCHLPIELRMPRFTVGQLTVTARRAGDDLLTVETDRGHCTRGGSIVTNCFTSLSGPWLH